MIWALLVGVSLLGLALSAFFSGAETGIYCLSRLRLQLGAQRGDRASLRLSRLLKDEPGALTTTLVGTNVMNYVTTTTVAYMLAEGAGFAQLDTEVYTVLLLTPIVFVFGEVVPKNLFQRYPDGLMAWGSGLLALADRLFRATGMVWLLTRLSSTIRRLVGGERGIAGAGINPRRRVIALLQEALAGETAAEAQTELIDRVMSLSDTPLHAVMVPRNEVTVMNADIGRRELLRFARRTSYARVPVYQGDRRRVTGYVDLDELIQSHDWTRAAERMEPILMLRPHDTVAAAIDRMHESRQPVAAVTDRSGLLLGLVTLKDLLGEVVGELTFLD